MLNFEYHTPGPMKEALSLLDKQREEAKVLAGGTDLIVQMKDGRSHASHVVDVKNIPELNRLEWSEEEGLHIGAAVPISMVAAYPPVADRFDMLSQACSHIGSVQIRNRGTIGGNICNAAPSANTPPPLLCLGARAIVARLDETRIVPLESFFRGPGRTALADNELLVEIEIPTPPTLSAGCYLQHTPREEMDIAVVGVASFLVLTPHGNLCHEAKIALGAVAPIPLRAHQAEAFLAGKAQAEEVIEEAAERVAKATIPISDVRGSVEYRRELARVLTRRTIRRAWEALEGQT